MIALTFDDGILETDALLGERLSEAGLPSTFFITSDTPTAPKKSWSTIATLYAQGHQVTG